MRKGKKSNISVSKSTLYTQKKINFSKIVCFSTNSICGLKKMKQLLGETSKILWGKFQKMLVIQFPYMELYD